MTEIAASQLRREIERRRTFAIISHPDAGKTTLTEKLLLYGGAIRQAGAVRARRVDRHATSDWLALEKQRGISVSSSVMTFEHEGLRVNILDTPGHHDFSEDTYRTLTAADSAVMLIDAAKGVEPQTRKLFKVCRMRGIPIFTFVNKMDRHGRDPLDIMGEIEDVLGMDVVPANWPVGAGSDFRGIYDLLERRLILFSGLHPIRRAISEDDGKSWSELEPIGDYGGIVAMGCVARMKNGDYIAQFHVDGRFIGDTHRPESENRFFVYQVRSKDGGLAWGAPRVIATHPKAHLCEPGIVRSPDGERLAVLFRENSRKMNSFVIFSDDEAKSWSEPKELPAALTGDRHTGVYAPDGRLFLSFRDTTRESATQGDWVGWVGTFEDIVEGREGQYRVRIKDNKHRWDCAYPGVVILPDGTIVTTTYGHWDEGESPYVLSVRFRLEELDELLKEK